MKLLSRKGRDDTEAYFEVARELTKIRVETAILDGEVVVTDAAGRPSFGLLQHRINLTKPADIERAAKAYPAQLMLFDILELNGQSTDQEDLSGTPRDFGGLDTTRAGSLIQVRRSSKAICRQQCRRAINFNSRSGRQTPQFDLSTGAAYPPGSRSNCIECRRS